MAYSRINWENGEKTSNGYVTIDGTDYTVVDPIYSGNTPINADNLNLMDAEIFNNQPLTTSSGVSASASGNITVGKLGIEWGTVFITPSNGYGTILVNLINTYKNSPCAMACGGLGTSTTTDVGTFSVNTTSINVYLTSTANTARTCRYLVVGELE